MNLLSESNSLRADENRLKTRNSFSALLHGIPVSITSILFFEFIANY